MFWTSFFETIETRNNRFEARAFYEVNGRLGNYQQEAQTLTEARKLLDTWRSEFRNQKENDDVRTEQSA